MLVPHTSEQEANNHPILKKKISKLEESYQYIETEKKELLEQAENVNISFMNLNDMLLLTNINSAREKSIWK